MDVHLSLGELGIIEQGSSLVTLEADHALELSDRLARWAASRRNLLSTRDDNTGVPK
jgi:hypothetical protein